MAQSSDEGDVSIYVRFDGKSYKLPDALTLGRGEPFDVIDRTLARAHARLVFRGGKWKIKDLFSDCGIMLNGNKIKPGKFISVQPGDKIQLGNVPLEVYESLPEGAYTEVQSFAAHDITDYAPYFYAGLIVIGLVIAFSESSGDTMDDVFFIGIVAAFLKLASVITRALRTVYFPVRFVLESNFTYAGATFHLSDGNNFTFKYEHVTKWYMIGKCFFIHAYNRELIFLLDQGQEELASLLRDHCQKKRAIGEPVLEKLALLPFVFVLIAWVGLSYADGRFFHFVGHGFGALGVVGLLALFFSEHLRELLPFPSSFSGKKLALSLATISAVTMVMQFGKFQSHYRFTKTKNSLYSCVSLKNCKSLDFTVLRGKNLLDEERLLLQKACQNGNPTACPKTERLPASKK